MSTLAVKPWPKLLREVGRHRARTTRDLHNMYGTIAAGTVGEVWATSRWDDMCFTAERCSCCGVALRMGGITRRSIELLEPVLT